ncbi:glycosyltransferase family protein [Clostridiaceae bacterium M8S5]|nr:glycosyltransferase family protein [Clostridiaceae bacterium M8S5]
MKTGVIIQARMGSTRLPNKVMKKIKDKTVLSHVIERVKKCKLIDDIIIATTTSVKDDIIEKEANRCGVKSLRGSEEDVLSRYYYAAKENDLDIIVRITSDCPLIDPKVTDELIDYYLNSNFDIVTNAGADLSKRTYPRGLDTEVFSFLALEEAFDKACEKYQREHVTPFIYENCKNTYHYMNPVDYSRYRLTLDTKEDLKLIEEIYDRLYKGRHDFYLEEIMDIFNKELELYDINAHIEQKELIS